MTNDTKARYQMMAAAFLWSLGGVLIKLVDWNPLAIAGMRSFIAAVVIFFFLKKPVFTWSKVQVGAAVAYACVMIFFVTSTRLTTAANAALLQFTSPIYIGLFSYFVLKEKVTRIDWAAILLVMVGMVLFFLDDVSFTSFWGNLLGMFTGISFAVMVLLLRKQKNARPMESVLLGNLLAGIVTLPFMFQSMPSAMSWLGLLLLGTLQLGLAYVFYATAVKHISAMESALIPVIEPLFNPLWVLLIVGEAPGMWTIFGGLLVVGGVTGRYLFHASMQRTRQSIS
ncbi:MULTISPECIES: DMT family transporter [Anoxynatronum]|uniref:Threonine/homoserine efflux transporter RhtA n=2 Tax=Anoxynatronum TaxID=210622 RepID=A0AA46AHH6_9CLOT|nr:EamA family transporter [Anoxynatronum buryatiense]SMP39904.1 Threonine/homoserine efflux transporter RhtA [Anoxynatronum buryatiense]